MHHPRKRFGQNFLRDRQIMGRILSAVEIALDDQILEIGPGQGALTDLLLSKGVRVQAFEIDRDLAARLLERKDSNLNVVVGDALCLDWQKLLSCPPYKLVANLPYNISSQILFKILDHRNFFSRLVLMFQKEVAERIMAEPATKSYGILSVLVQTWFDVSMVTKVSPQAFYPKPKVDSAVLLLEPLPRPRSEIDNETLYKALVRSAFSHRRKTLRNSLMGSGWPADIVDRACRDVSIDSSRRGETLNIEEFASLANHINKLMQGDKSDV
ncbi:MAG: ribosomal RNA small subunit methyltransferase A [Deltaproteobacteria bacterium]|jgi:16S rRNA (adenine1518-N6/adenine1519-N6)-dimethyltransferase|nr:ribosomal RNA small subunit methyltransferase A [Deltaproteobacteria bacterium]